MSYSSILYYKFFPVSDPALFRLWQWELCRRLGLKGRIIVSHQGINGTLSGSIAALKEYKKECATWPSLGKLQLKWTHGLAEVPFPKLSVKHRSELVTFNRPDIAVDEGGVVNGGTHLNSKQLHALLNELSGNTGKPIEELLGEDILFLDGRNSYEYEIGRFKNSFDPGVGNAKEFQAVIDSGVLDEWKSKPVISYCTGGIRCELLTPLLKEAGFQEVYQVDGGIVRYLEESQNSQDLWEGSVYTFDTRKKFFGEYSSVVGECSVCSTPTDNQENCRKCETQIVVCSDCWSKNDSCVSCKHRLGHHHR